jgi:hypothetical protein
VGAFTFKGLNLRKLVEAAFDTTSGHDHDGKNSKAVTVGTVAAGALAANATGRAMMADDYFNAATLAAKVDADAFTNAVCDAAYAANAFAADADSRAIFADGIWTLAKLAAEARTHILSAQVETLAAGVDIADRVIFEVPAGFAAKILTATLISQGTAEGIDGGNKCTVLLEDASSNALVTKEFDLDPAFPASGSSVSLGTISTDYDDIAEGGKILLSVTNGTNANPPAFVLQITYALSAAA